MDPPTAVDPVGGSDRNPEVISPILAAAARPVCDSQRSAGGMSTPTFR